MATPRPTFALSRTPPSPSTGEVSPNPSGDEHSVGDIESTAQKP